MGHVSATAVLRRGSRASWDPLCMGFHGGVPAACSSRGGLGGRAPLTRSTARQMHTEGSLGALEGGRGRRPWLLLSLSSECITLQLVLILTALPQ